MKTDRELLELAARAAGFPDGWVVINCDPLIDDGDALRLAVKLRIHISPRLDHVEARFFDGSAWNCFKERYGVNKNAATRRAITRAAAQMQLNKEQANG